jgi:muramoyltetrapeptide carboxypeptidase
MEKFNRGIAVLQSLGFQARIPREIFKQKRYLAGDDMERAAIVNLLFSDPDIKGILCARGGYGALRILNHLDWDLIRKNPKPFMGYSDITAILTAILSKTGVPVLHGPHVVSLAAADAKTLASFADALSGPAKTIEIPDGKAIRGGVGVGMLTGGNLATLCHLLGTRFQPDFSGAVLFFEDIGEPAYKIDRMLTQMKLAGVFNKIRGVVTGSFENCDNGEYIEEIVGECFDEYHVPILSGLDAGHGKTNLSLSFGRRIKMDTMAMKIEWV